MTDDKPSGVVFVTEAFPQPSETFIMRDLDSLQRMKVNYKVVCLRSESPERLAMFYLSPDLVRVAEKVASANVPASAFVMPGLKGHLAAIHHKAQAWSVAAAVADLPFKPVRIHALFAGLPVFLARAAAIHLGVPFSVSIHAGDVYLGAPHYHALLKEADLIIGCNQCVMDWLAAKEPALAPKLKLVHHGLNTLGEPLTVPVIERGKPVRLLAVGRFVEKKGFHILVEAVKVLLNGGKPVHLTIAGDGPESRVRELVKKLGIAPHVTFSGWIGGGVEGVVKSFGPFDILVVPSVVDKRGDRDGIPNVLLEGWKIGLPVVAASAGGIGEVARNDENAIVVPPGEPAALALGIGRLINEAGLAQKLVNGGIATLEAGFNPATNVAAWAKLLLADK